MHFSPGGPRRWNDERQGDVVMAVAMLTLVVGVGSRTWRVIVSDEVR